MVLLYFTFCTHFRKRFAVAVDCRIEVLVWSETKHKLKTAFMICFLNVLGDIFGIYSLHSLEAQDSIRVLCVSSLSLFLTPSALFAIRKRFLRSAGLV